MNPFHIPILLGTAREERRSERVARFAHALLSAREGVTTELVDVRDHSYSATIPPWGKGGANEAPTAWKKIMGRADALIIVSPEYNHGYPGELKLLLDSLEDEYVRKPFGLIGVSEGAWGGMRGLQSLRTVISGLEGIVTPFALPTPKVKELFTEAGECTDPPYGGKLEKLFDEVVWYAGALARARKESQ